MCIVWKWITEVGGVKERTRGNETGAGEKDKEREIYIFVFQMKEKVDLESLNSFCEVKTLSKNKTKTWTVLFQLLYAYL